MSIPKSSADRKATIYELSRNNPIIYNMLTLARENDLTWEQTLEHMVIQLTDSVDALHEWQLKNATICSRCRDIIDKQG